MIGDRCEKCGVLEGTLRYYKQQRYGRVYNRICYGLQPVKIIHHHDKGYDKNSHLMLLCVSCHRRIHIRYRKERLCKFSVEEINDLSHRSLIDDRKYIHFFETIAKNIQLYEKYVYSRSGSVYINIGFCANNKRKLFYIGE